MAQLHVYGRVLEYACQAWHSSLTAAQSKAIEAIQRRAIQIIFADNDYTMSLIRARMDTLESRRAELTEQFFRRSVLHEASCLHYLYLTLNLSSSRIQMDALGHTLTSFCSVCRQFFGFIPGDVHSPQYETQIKKFVSSIFPTTRI